MSDPSKPTDEHDDVTWFNALTGRLPDSVAPSVTTAEGKRLREILCALDREEAASEKLDADWERLRFRLRREELIGKGGHRPIAYWAMAASVFMAVGIAWLYTQNGPVELPESQIVRGGQTTTVVIRVPDPSAVAEQLLKVCREAGIAIQRRDNADGTPMLDLAIPAQPPAILVEILKNYATELPPSGKVTLVLMRSQ